MQMGMAEKNGLLMFIILCLIILIHSHVFLGTTLIILTILRRGGVTEWLEAQTRNLEVPGSSPLPDH